MELIKVLKRKLNTFIYRNKRTRYIVSKFNKFGFTKKIDNYPIAIYDLRNNPTTFDFGVFIFFAYIYYNNVFDLFIVTGLNLNNYQTKKEKLLNLNDNINKDVITNRINGILIPLARSCNKVRNVNVIEGADDIINLIKIKKNIYPKFYDGRILDTFETKDFYKYLIRYSHIDFKFKAPQPAIEDIKFFLMRYGIKEKFVVFTIRKSKSDHKRNSDLERLFEISNIINTLGINSIFIDDTENLTFGIENKVYCDVAAISLPHRIALYELASLNVLGNNGPGITCILGEAKFIFENFLVKDSIFGTSSVIKHFGLKAGDQPFTDGRGYIIWDEQDPKYISNMIEKIVNG
jgi:hypothetical protein